MSSPGSHLAKALIDLPGRRFREECEKLSILDAGTDETVADVAIVNVYRRPYADALFRVRMGLTSLLLARGVCSSKRLP